MSDAAFEKHQPDRLEEAKNIALGWRIVGQIEPKSLEEAVKMLRDCSAHAARVYELLYAEIAQRAKE